MGARRWLFLAGLGVLLAACGESGPPLSPGAERGRHVYLSVCIACHHAHPDRDGALGPAIAGASRELVEARVLRAEYPPGYVPKRPTRAMPSYPQIARHIDELVAYLAEVVPARPAGAPAAAPASQAPPPDRASDQDLVKQVEQDGQPDPEVDRAGDPS
jgi:mono/diheme cytochrome c family protein